MASKRTPKAAAPTANLTNDVATAADVNAAAKLDPSPLSPVRRVTTTFVDLLASPELQARLTRIAGELKSFRSFRGQNVDAALALVNEGKRLTAIADRLENSVGRVHQRIVQINAQVSAFQTALAGCEAEAAEDSGVAKALGPLVLARAVARGVAKGQKTRKRNQRAKKPKAGG